MKGMRWPMVPLGDVARPIVRAETPDPGTAYRLIGVKWWGEGAYQHSQKSGAETQAPSLFRVQTGDIVINKIWARHGSVSVIPAHLDGAHGSSEFPTFRADDSRLSPDWIRWWSRSPECWAACGAGSFGTSGKNRIRPEQFLSIAVPLPPLEEQRRIVARLDAVSARLNARAHAAERQEAELAAMLRALAATDTTPTPMRELLTPRPLDVEVQREGQYQFSGVYSFGRGVFRGQRKSGADFAYPRLTTLRAGDFTYPKLMAWEGAYGIVPPECDGTVVSPEFPVFAVNVDCVLPDVLAVHFSDPRTWERLSGSMKRPPN